MQTEAELAQHASCSGTCCPVCDGANVRAFKVYDSHGAWSEWLDCKATHGSGWFVFSDIDACWVLCERLARGYAATGGAVEFVELPTAA